VKIHIKAVLLLALACVLAPGVASADTLYACKLNGIGAIRIVNSTTICTQIETRISWSSTGPQGVAGPQGPAGAAGLVE